MRTHLPQDHALADQALEGLLGGHGANVIQHLVPEPVLHMRMQSTDDHAC